MRRLDKTTIFAAAGILLAPQEPVSVPSLQRAEARPVDLAICLDTSGSMQGLIDSARQGIWAIVNDLALAQPTPKLRVALLTFGNDGHSPESGWVRIDTGFTEDLDVVSQQLFALTTNGGTELVGRVLQTAVDRLEWSDDPNALELIVVAGNESADQDQQVRFADACKHAIGRGIVVNSIYCGDPNDQIAPAWREVAKLADGRFHAIDKDHGTVAIETPFDEQLRALSARLNETYLPYGAHGQVGWANQRAQDKNAESCNEQVVAQRALTKSTANYCASAWDLVDAYREKKVELGKLKPEELPEVLRGKTVVEQQQHIEALAKQRAGIQAEVQELAKKRDAVVAEEMQRRAIDATKSFDFAVRQAVREQAEAKGLQIGTPEPAPPAERR